MPKTQEPQIMSYRHAAAAMNVALSHDTQVNALGVKTSWQNGL
jgi:hypothetical protein